MALTGFYLPRSQGFWRALERDDDTFTVVRRIELSRAAQRRSATIYVIGDSAVREGVLTEMLAAATGHPVLKLAVAGGTPFDSLLIARRLRLRRGDVLLVGISPFEFRNDANDPATVRSHPTFAYLLGLGTCRDTVNFRLTTDEWAESALRDASSLYRYRTFVQLLLVHDYDRGPWVEFKYKGRIDGRAFGERMADGTYQLDSGNASFGPEQITARSLNALKLTAESAGARLILFQTPVNPVIRAGGLIEDSTDAAYAAALRRFEVIDPAAGTEPLLDDQRDFNDFFHLNAFGRRLYSRELGRRLAEVLGHV